MAGASLSPLPNAETGARIAMLDILRGVAVMGILAANIAAFGLPEAAYFSPAALGSPAPADLAAWGLTFVLVEGKMRGLFSFLFGASMLLVIDRARAAGDSPGAVHALRMAWLFAFGMIHLYLFWWGDILTHYALVGALAFLFHRLHPRWLIAVGTMCIAAQLLTVAQLGLDVVASHAAAAAAGAPHAAIAQWDVLASAFGQPRPGEVAAEIAAVRGDVADNLAWRWAHATDPFTFLPMVGAETLGYMLFGMAGLRLGFLTGAWTRARYTAIAAGALGLTIPAYIALALFDQRHDFDPAAVFLASFALATPLRPVMVAGYVALVILVARPGGWLTSRLAAAGRMAFTNYLGTTLVCTTVFYGYGLGLFGAMSRAALFIVVAAIWTVMLAASKPWLEGHLYGPLEWLWRSLARMSWQPMRRARG